MGLRITSASVLAAGMIAGISLAPSPAAHAVTPVLTRHVAMNCLGLSPNIIDLPYNGGVQVLTRVTQPGTITVIGGSNSATRYLTDASITIRNTTARASGTVTRRYLHTAGGSAEGGYTIRDVYTGPGRVTITVTPINHGVITIPGPTCRGTITVR